MTTTPARAYTDSVIADIEVTHARFLAGRPHLHKRVEALREELQYLVNVAHDEATVEDVARSPWAQEQAAEWAQLTAAEAEYAAARIARLG